MARIYPCDSMSSRAPALYTYYVIMTFLVVFLAVTLIWLPFLQLITEFSTVVSKVITFLDANFLEHDGDCCFDNLASFLVNERFLIIVSAVLMGFLIFLASGDFLIMAACYIGNLPNTKGLETIKRILLKLILYLLYLNKGKCVRFISREEIDSSEAGSSTDVKHSKNLLALVGH